MNEMHELAKVVYDEILKKVQFGGLSKNGIIVLQGEPHKLSYDIAHAVTKHLQSKIAGELKKLVNSHIFNW